MMFSPVNPLRPIVTGAMSSWRRRMRPPSAFAPSHARRNDQQFLFIAEASESWSEPLAQGAPFTPYYDLLSAGFDGWYGSFFNLKDWNSSEKFEREIFKLNDNCFAYNKYLLPINHFEMCVFVFVKLTKLCNFRFAYLEVAYFNYGNTLVFS